jgi:GAT domain
LNSEGLSLTLNQPLPRVLNAPPFNPHQQNYFARNHRPRGLPPPDELAARIEEAKTSAKLLLQVVQSTPTNDVLNNDLIKEFADRCQSASRSVQGYIHSDNPAPDEDTLLTLIETNDQLSVAMSKHQRALLQARRAMPTSPPPQTASGGVILGPPPVPGSRRAQFPPTKTSTPENPFADPHAQPQGLVDSSNPTVPDFQAPLQPQNQGFEPPPGPPPQQQRQPAPMGGGFRPTASYIGRQDSAVNHTTMHGGGSLPVAEEDSTTQSGTGPASPMESRTQPPQGVAYRY